MAKPVEITDKNFDEMLSTELPVLVDFWAEWCGPCKLLSPVVDHLAEEYEGKVLVAHVDVDANPQVAVKFGIRSIPTLLFFKNKEVVDKQIGAVPKSVIVKKLDALI